MFYPNNLCFEDISTISLHANWFSDKYQNIMIMFNHCQNTTENGNKCAPQSDIDLFIQSNSFYLIRQETLIDNNMKFEQAKDFKNEETGEYFPLKIGAKSEIYIPLMPNSLKLTVPILEFRITINTIEIDDSLF